MQQKIRSYFSSLHNAVRSHDPYHMESLCKMKYLVGDKFAYFKIYYLKLRWEYELSSTKIMQISG